MEKQQNQKIKKENFFTSSPRMGVITLIISTIIFSGLLNGREGWSTAFDFVTLNGNYGTIKNIATATFMGSGGTGADAGFMLALSLIPSVMLAMGIVAIVEQTGGLEVAQKLLSPVVRPLMGLPGTVTLALITSLQSTDAGAGMTKKLFEDGFITEKERAIFVQFQFTGNAGVNNYLTLGTAVFTSIVVPIIIPLILILILKFFATNVTRVVINKFYREDA